MNIRNLFNITLIYFLSSCATVPEFEEILGRFGDKNQMDMTNYLFTQGNLCWGRGPSPYSPNISITRLDELHIPKTFNMTYISISNLGDQYTPYMEIYVSAVSENQSYISVKAKEPTHPRIIEMRVNLERWISGDDNCV